MERKKIITIAGKPGSGKSTTSKRLASELNYKHFSSGDLFRATARDRSITVDVINQLAENDRSIDEVVDQKLRDMGASEDELVIDSRMAWHWMPQSFRVYLDLDLSIAADRIYNSSDRDRFEGEDKPASLEEYEAQLKKRLDSEAKRYLALYNQNPYDSTHYDLVVDTHANNPDQVVQMILSRYQEWLQETK